LAVTGCQYEEQLCKLQKEDLQVMEQDTIKVSTFLSTVGDHCKAYFTIGRKYFQVLPEAMSSFHWQQLMCQQDEVNYNREQDHIIWLMTQVCKHSTLDTRHCYNAGCSGWG